MSFIHVKCAGHILASGDFGGNVHLWDVRIVDGASRVQVRNYRKFEAHKGHVVCMQLNARRIVTGEWGKTSRCADPDLVGSSHFLIRKPGPNGSCSRLLGQNGRRARSQKGGIRS